MLRNAAVAGPDGPDGDWRSEEIPATLDWSAVPPSKLRADGGGFRMLHVVARRAASAESPPAP